MWLLTNEISSRSNKSSKFSLNNHLTGRNTRLLKLSPPWTLWYFTTLSWMNNKNLMIDLTVFWPEKGRKLSNNINQLRSLRMLLKVVLCCPLLANNDTTATKDWGHPIRFWLQGFVLIQPQEQQGVIKLSACQMDKQHLKPSTASSLHHRKWKDFAEPMWVSKENRQLWGSEKVTFWLLFECAFILHTITSVIFSVKSVKLIPTWLLRLPWCRLPGFTPTFKCRCYEQI